MEREKKVGFHAQALQAALEAIAMDENTVMQALSRSSVLLVNGPIRSESAFQ